MNAPMRDVWLDTDPGFDDWMAWALLEADPAVRLHGGMSVLESLPEKPVDLRPLGADDLCYIQFSSGSTRHPHGVQITQAALMANLAGITGPGGLEVVAGDRAASWLPRTFAWGKSWVA